MASATLQAMVAPRIIFAVALGISGEQISPTVSNANTWPKKVGGKCCISFSAIRRISPVRFTARRDTEHTYKQPNRGIGVGAECTGYICDFHYDPQTLKQKRDHPVADDRTCPPAYRKEHRTQHHHGTAAGAANAFRCSLQCSRRTAVPRRTGCHSNAPKHPIMALFIEIFPFTKAVPLRWSKNRADRRENSLAMPPRSVLAAPIYWHQVITHTTIRHPPQSQRRSHNWTHQMQGRLHSRSHPPRCPAAAWGSCAQCCCILFRFQIPSC